MLVNRFLFAALLSNAVVALAVTANGYDKWMPAALLPTILLLGGFKAYCKRAFDGEIHFYTSRLPKDVEQHAESGKQRHSDRVGVKYGHPVLTKPLIRPMVHSKAKHLLAQVCHGFDSPQVGTGKFGPSPNGFNEYGMTDMLRSATGKPAAAAATAAASAPFEFVSDDHMDFTYYKDRPEFSDEHGGDGEVYGVAADISRPGTPHSRAASSRTNSLPLAGGGGPDAAGAGQGMTYPRGYHRTPSAMRDRSSSSFSHASLEQGQLHLLQASAPPGRSVTPASLTPGSCEETSYEYFRGRGGAMQ